MKTTASTEVEWVTITPDKVVVANTENIWICSAFANNGQLAEPMTENSNAVKTGKLLQGTIAAAKAAIPFSCKPPKSTPSQLVWRLIYAYHMAQATSILMRKAGRNFAIALRHALGNWAYYQAQQEAKNAQLILQDIESLGYNAEELVQAVMPSVSTTLLNYFRRSVDDLDPIDCVGYRYATECLSLNYSQGDIQQQECLFSADSRGGCLKISNSPDYHTKQLKECLDLVARLSARERTRVMRSCYETALLLFSLPIAGYLSEAELQCMFEPFKLGRC